jgi:RHS repeat-associated protein
LNKPTDTSTGLDQLGARQYDPSTGRFISVDPMVDQTQQPYSYAGDNPVTNTDPTGLHLEGPGACDNPAGCGQGGNGAGTGTLANGGGDPSQPAPPTGTQGGGGGGSGGGGNCYPYCGIPSQATLNSLCNKACQASAPAPPVNLEYSNVGLGYGYGENNWTSPWDAIYPVAIIGTTIGELSCVAPFDGICEADTTAEVQSTRNRRLHRRQHRERWIGICCQPVNGRSNPRGIGGD